MSQFERPSGAYAGAAGLANRTKYQDDAVAVPKQPISSAKMDGEFNYVIDSLNAIHTAKGSRASIKERLDVTLNADGTLKAGVTAVLDDWVAHTAPTTLLCDSDNILTLGGGDYTALYPVHRRVRAVVDGSVFYGDVLYSEFAEGVTTVELVGVVDEAGAEAFAYGTLTSVAYGPLVSGATGNAQIRQDKLVIGQFSLEAAGADLKLAPVSGGVGGAMIGAGGLLGVADGAVSLEALAAGVLERLVPVGTVLPYGGASAPAGYLLCAGQAVSRTTYAALFAAIGTVYGVGNGSTTFNLPDLRGRSVFGKDDMNGTAANRVTNAVSGVAATTLGAAGGSQAMQQHTHTVTDPGHSHTVAALAGQGTPAGGSVVAMNTGGTTNTTSAAQTGITLQNSGTGTSQNMPPVLVLNYMIKA